MFRCEEIPEGSKHPCGEINRDYLCAAKFLKDAVDYRDAGTTMAGNVLDRKGMVGAPANEFHSALLQQFPGRFVSVTDLSLYWPSGANRAEPSTAQPARSMKEVLENIERELKKSTELRGLTRRSRGLQSRVRQHMQLMLAAYVNNPGMHSIDLQAAVNRQGIFVAKMAHLDWLHSPNATSTMTNLITKYDEWLGLIRAHPGKLMVPTLDVDLAWHTAQLSPKRYYIKTTSTLSQFLNHDDKIADTKLSDAFAETTKLYEKTYNKEYSSCTCWYCESELFLS